MFFANPVYRVRSHPSAWHLETFQWHGRTRSLNNSIFLFEIYQFSLGNILPLFRTSSASRKWKNWNVVRFADLVHRVQRDPSVILGKFSSDTTGHGLRITKRPAVWYFSIFSFKNTNFYWKIFNLYLESSSASREWKNSNVVRFADPVNRVCRNPSVSLKKISLRTLLDKNSKYCRETVKWRTVNVFTIKQLTICTG